MWHYRYIKFYRFSKKCDNKINAEEQDIHNRAGVIKVRGLKELFSKLKRIQKVDILRNKRNMANRESRKNKEVKQLEKEALTIIDKEYLR